ncbi:MAG TPA: transposase, partial [Aggregatilineales bacterium]|nr:transposase [Aggregatilineales bacterium]
TTPMTAVDPSSRIEPMPTEDETRMDIIPPPPRLPDQNWIDRLAEREQHPISIDIEDHAPVDTDSALIPVPQDDVITSEPLVQASIEDITQRLAVLEMEDIEEILDGEVESMRITDHVLAHYALQLTQFSMESSSLGAIITRSYDILAQAGDLGDPDWDTIVKLINESWNQPGNVRTRVLYRHVDIGEILIYSIQTIQELMLTLIFDAETPLKIIRRQAARLTESLKNIPMPDEAFINAEPTQPITLAEPIALIHEAPETDPDERREGTAEVRVHEVVEQPVAPQEVAVVSPPAVRPPGTYIGYACVWLVEDERDTINPTAAKLITQWIEEICVAQEWDFNRTHIESNWIYVSVEVPSGTLPHTVAHTLMNQTAERALTIDPTRAIETPWSAGYLVRTPPDYIQEQDIQRFIRFYRSTQNGS